MERKDPRSNRQQLGNLLELYKKRFKPPQASVEKECLAVIEELTPFTLTLEQVTYTISTRTLAITAPSIIKSELRLYHQQILVEVQKRLTESSAPQVII
jgi:uncharacterized protein YqiB (DUF1249 family)